uniref:NADH-ubiquinone oxidoreductase chain 3 n=1 Tax=Orussus occidentalis TaxID=576952 RepID=C4NCE9_ORUOC|nr:NADH dehydrogenase subunit 3 [Orussus occidentalis]ACJ69700.1 NADH dehydrogenase subunit 3 [Orussus occidentalis]
MMILLEIFIICSIISSAMLYLNFILYKKMASNREKMSPFECGFDPLNSSRIPFSTKFYLISVMFLIFDIEISILIPIIPSLNLSNPSSKMINIITIIIIILMWGLLTEWKEGSLKWIK